MKNIRKADINDEIQLHKLIMELEEMDIDKDLFSTIFKTNLSNPNIYYLVYEEDGKILGFISLHLQYLLHHTSIVAEVQELVVAGFARKRGIGKLLFQRAIEISKENNCTLLEVACNQKRTESHKFYYAVGMNNSHFRFSLPLSKDAHV